MSRNSRNRNCRIKQNEALKRKYPLPVSHIGYPVNKKGFQG